MITWPLYLAGKHQWLLLLQSGPGQLLSCAILLPLLPHSPRGPILDWQWHHYWGRGQVWGAYKHLCTAAGQFSCQWVRRRGVYGIMDAGGRVAGCPTVPITGCKHHNYHKNIFIHQQLCRASLNIELALKLTHVLRCFWFGKWLVNTFIQTEN